MKSSIELIPNDRTLEAATAAPFVLKVGEFFAQSRETGDQSKNQS